MFDHPMTEIGDLAALDDAALIDAVAGWVRAENASCARKLAVLAELFCRRTGLPADERETWWIDPCAALGSELGAALGISSGLALAQTHRGVALRDRLPKVAALFEAGLIGDLLVRAIVWRTELVTDPEVMAAVDAQLADEVGKWGALTVNKTRDAIDRLIDAHDPAAVRRTRTAENARDVEFGSPGDPLGFTSLWARMYTCDGAALEKRLDAMARSVCPDDPRTIAERRADALGALATRQTLDCRCGADDCAAGGAAEVLPTAVIHVIADQTAVAAARSELRLGATPPTATSLPTGASPPDATPPTATSLPTGAPPPDATPPNALATPHRSAVASEPAPPPMRPPTNRSGPPLPRDGTPATPPPPPPGGAGRPAFVLGGGVLPASLLAGVLARATVRDIRHPADAPAEHTYRPSAALAAFVRCRDLTCRFPACDVPADRCDIDHTVPHPAGPTHASKLRC